ncbi:MAG: hypothetical protein ACRD96_24740, partial [Bryobacteraceae bacterium]
LKMNGSPVMMARRNGAEVFAGCKVFTSVPRAARVESPQGAFRFYEHFYDCHLVKSGMHHPDGILWIRTPQRHGLGGQATRVPLTNVAPTLLALCDLPQPEFMKGKPVDVTLDADGVRN